MPSDVIANASDAWDAWWNSFATNWLVASGVVTAENYAAWHAMYPHYIPTVRDVNGVLTSVTAGNNTGSGGWVFHAATGSDLDIINLLDSIAEYVGSIVNRVAQNTVAQKFDQLYQQNDGMGIFAKAISVPEQNIDVHSFGEDYQNLQVQYRPDVIVVQRENGTRGAYQFSDPLLLESLRSMGPASIPWLRGAQAVTRTFSALTTSMDPAFGGKNAMRDFAKAVTYGSFATNEVTGAARWVRNLARVAQGQRRDDGRIREPRRRRPRRSEHRLCDSSRETSQRTGRRISRRESARARRCGRRQTAEHGDSEQGE